MLRSSITALLISLIGSAATAEPLSRSDLETQLLDTVFDYKGKENGRILEGVIVYRSDNRILIRTDEGYLDGGKWRMKRKSLCTKIELLRDSRETCFEVFDDAGAYLTSHGFVLRRVPDGTFPTN